MTGNKNNLTQRILSVIGDFEPDKHINPKVIYQITNEYIKDGVRFQKLDLLVDSDDKVPCYLLTPINLKDKVPGILCLHQTTVDKAIGIEEVVGNQGNLNFSYAFELAKKGFVTISPEYPFFGDYSITEDRVYSEFGYESVSMKGLMNHMAALNLLESLSFVNSSKLGCIGHSLGGTNALLLTHFDKRIKIAVISAGFTTFEKYAAMQKSGDLSRWALRDKYMPNVFLKYKNDPARMPFDFPELLASLSPTPLFVSTPTEDEIFDYSGALLCVNNAQKKYSEKADLSNFEHYSPRTKHDFPEKIRARAYSFIHKNLN
ncbi:alpha/beta hydrolase family protein [Maribacter sp. 2304DJ31-5]|uniref:alpha/beta hydrolase family protein n=1 Tax=Maribacter sp. 2304DJ31-5 TaxID=3386273 RepID=UPI0039BC3A90